MANYSLVANSTFQPFIYQELSAPLDRQAAYHEKLMDEYDKLSSQADVLEAMGANDRDKGVYQQYKNYSDRLRAEADNLYRNGLNTESRMRLSELRRMYNTDIVPIQNAWQKREKEAELQMKAQLDASSKGIDLYFSRNAADTPLQSYLDNPNQTFRTINGQALMNEVAAQFKGLANQLQEGKIKKEQLSPIEYSIITQKGMDYNQYMDFINNPNDPRFANIRGIINSTLNAHGAGDFDATTQQRLFGLASQGVAAGVGERGMQFHTDEWAKMQETYNQQLDLARKKGEIKDGNEVGDAVGFDTSEYDLPMMGVDSSHAKEQEEALETLGYITKKDRITGKKVLSPTGKVKIKFRPYSAKDELVGGTSSEPEIKEVSIFNKDGKIMTRSQFVAQAGKNERLRKTYNEYFNKMVNAGKTLGIYGRQYTQNELTNQYNKLRDNSAATFATVHALNYKKEAWNPTMKSMMVQEIKDYKGGKPVFDSERVSLNSLLNKKDGEGTISVAPYWSTVEGHEGLILATTEDGKAHRYFVPADQIAESNIQGNRGARYWFRVANQARTNGDTALERQAKANGLSALYRGLTLQSNGQENDVNRQATRKEAGLQ